MRVGPEQFIYRDFAFIDAMIMPVVGPRTIAIYDVLRRHIWRTASRGSKRSKDAFRAGKLSSSIGRQKIADLSGVSVRTIQRHLNRLRDIGWVKWESGNGTGETVVYELGFRTQDSVEVFYADAHARGLWLGLEELAVDEGVERVTNLPCDVRLDFARKWFALEDGEGEGEGGGDKNVTRVVSPVSPGVVTKMAPNNREPFGDEIEKSEECPGGCAPETQTGPGPKHLDQPAGQERSKRSRKKMEEEQVAPSLLLTEGEDSGHNERDRLAGAARAMERGKEKADSTQVADVQRRMVEQRSEKLAKKVADESKIKNLDGRQYHPTVVKAARHAWDVYKEEVEAWDSAFVVPAWKAKGSTKTRGQVLELVSMYGGEATEQALRYMVRNWNKIGERVFKNSPGGVPNLGRLFALHEQLFREATIWGRHREVLEQWEAWFKANPMRPAPSELKERYEGAQQGLSAIGLW